MRDQCGVPSGSADRLLSDPNQIESFWYFDGNFRPFSLTTENQIFLEENYLLSEKIEKKDCWASNKAISFGIALKVLLTSIDQK
jgi:hypothetical protein